VYDFTVPELNKFRELCNFSDDELEYFNLRAKHKSNVEIALTMNVSEGQVSKLARRVKDKIIRVTPYL
ncbi:helix-turn-helix transcriptional regulator, partial [Klebsiella pneumoniae]|nr:helix-turn-helix transcriptional regulator [Klebsiella pneumoniae]